MAYIIISESVLLIREGALSFGTRLQSGHSQDMSQYSRFSTKEETWTPKIHTVLRESLCEDQVTQCCRKIGENTRAQVAQTCAEI